MTLTEKVRAAIGGHEFRVFQVAAVSGGVSYTISGGAIGLNFVEWATYNPTNITLSAGSTTVPTLKVAESSVGGTNLTLSAHAVSGEGGVLEVWGW